MPNLIINDISITASKRDCCNSFNSETTLTLFANEKFSFQKLHPRPQEEDENWYNWNCVHWGTKWEPKDIQIKYDKDKQEIIMNFDTAWSPPTAFLTYLTSFYEGIKIVNNFTDEEYDCIGQSVIENGQSITSYFNPFDYTIDALRTFAKENEWFQIDEELFHTLNQCIEPGTETCNCFSNQDNLAKVVILTKDTETYEEMVDRSEKIFEKANIS